MIPRLSSPAFTPHGLPLRCAWPRSGPASATPVGELDIRSGGVVLPGTGLDFTAVASTGVFAPLNGTTVTTADAGGAPMLNFITFAAAPPLSR